MRKLLLILLCTHIIFSCESSVQNSSQSSHDTVKFLDGSTMKREPFINSCKATILKGKNQDMFVNGGDNYCNCFLEKISSLYTYKEFKELEAKIFEKDGGFEDKAYQLFNIPEIEKIANECIMDPVNINSDIKMEISSPEMMQVYIKQCKDEIRNSSSQSEYNEFISLVNLDDFCACYMQKILSEFTLKQLDYLDQPIYLIKVEEISEQCILENIK